MKINKVELTNFKFHHDLKFDIKEKNCLIYGENGTGKSSIYEALYSNFYYYKNSDIANGLFDIVGTFQHRDYPENTEVNILFDNQKNLYRENNEVTNLELLENKTIYFANERLLREITEKDFYTISRNTLQKHFPLLNNLHRIYSDWIRELNKPNNNQTSTEIISERIELDKKFKIQFFEQIPLDLINNILANDFDEKFEIEFNIENSSIEDKKLTYPKISIAVKGIDDRGNFQYHFNEAKLKLIGIAIYFALAKKYETDSELKLLVLDDFLTSLDMANRKLIVQYILDNFGEYQKIILTHNIQFYNMIIRLLDMREEKGLWDIKHLFLMNTNNEEEVSILTTRNNSYRDEAKKELLEGEYHRSGNALRKEFERVVNEFKELLEIGKSEQLNSIIGILKSDNNSFYKKPFSLLEKLHIRYQNINTIINSSENERAKIGQINYEVKEITLTLESEKCELSNLNFRTNKTPNNTIKSPASIHNITTSHQPLQYQ